MLDLGKLIDRHWGELKFYAAMGERPFAEISIEGKVISIRIVNLAVLAEAVISHIFRKKRFASFKLKTLKDSGYSVRIKYRGLELGV